MTELHEPHISANRRGVLIGAGVLGAGAVLTACGGTSPPAAGSPSGGETISALAAAKVKIADVAVGGGVILEDAKVVVTQPQPGQFRAFSAVCTHRQCVVSQVVDGTIDCPCHHSRFSVADGSVVDGPATQPLAARDVTVDGDSLTVA